MNYEEFIQKHHLSDEQKEGLAFVLLQISEEFVNQKLVQTFTTEELENIDIVAGRTELDDAQRVVFLSDVYQKKTGESLDSYVQDQINFFVSQLDKNISLVQKVTEKASAEDGTNEEKIKRLAEYVEAIESRNARKIQELLESN